MDAREIVYLVDSGRAHLDWQRFAGRWASTEKNDNPYKCSVMHQFFFGCGRDPTMGDHGT